MKQARILLLGGNYLPEPTGIGKYNGEMMTWLAQSGYECGVITSYPYYPYWKTQAPYAKKSFWYTKEKNAQHEPNITTYRCPQYIPQDPSGMKRIISDFSFFISALFQILILLFKKRYDYVLVVVPPFQLGLLGILYKNIRGAKLVYHIQDLQIDAAKELGMIKSEPVLKLLFKLEKFILSKADYISTISDGMIDKTMAKCQRPVIFFPNWVDTKYFSPIMDKSKLKAEYNIGPDEKVILYSGAIGEKQGLESIVFAAKALAGERIRFVICGTGPYQARLQALVTRNGLTNVLFLPLQPKESFNRFLNMADIHLVLQKANANDLVMPSKLTNILAVGGLALVTASKKTSLYNIISRNDMGIIVEPGDQDALLQSIKTAVDFPYLSIQKNAREYALKYLTIDSVIKDFLLQISVLKPTPGTLRPETIKVKTEVLNADVASV
ncbi:WcaI family glycosyltransferase [Flavitalea antarctica]